MYLCAWQPYLTPLLIMYVQSPFALFFSVSERFKKFGAFSLCNSFCGHLCHSPCLLLSLSATFFIPLSLYASITRNFYIFLFFYPSQSQISSHPFSFPPFYLPTQTVLFLNAHLIHLTLSPFIARYFYISLFFCRTFLFLNLTF
jgi:hypothetical protein